MSFFESFLFDLSLCLMPTKIPFFKPGKQQPSNTDKSGKVVPRTISAPLSYPPTPYSVFQQCAHCPPQSSHSSLSAGGSEGTVQQSTSIVTIEQARPTPSHASSYHSFHRPPPSIRMPSNMTVRRNEHVAVAFVSINDEQSQAIAKPLTELLNTIGKYLEGPDSKEGTGHVIIGELVDIDRLMKLHTTDAEQGMKERVAASKRKKARRLLGQRKQREFLVFVMTFCHLLTTTCSRETCFRYSTPHHLRLCCSMDANWWFTLQSSHCTNCHCGTTLQSRPVDHCCVRLPF
jgi:hypothetical protein